MMLSHWPGVRQNEKCACTYPLELIVRYNQIQEVSNSRIYQKAISLLGELLFWVEGESQGYHQTLPYTYYEGNNIQETPYNRVEQSDWLEYLDDYTRRSPQGESQGNPPVQAPTINRGTTSDYHNASKSMTTVTGKFNWENYCTFYIRFSFLATLAECKYSQERSPQEQYGSMHTKKWSCEGTV